MSADAEIVISSLHREALAYASRGVPVFPINPGMKTPAYTGSFHNATTDPAIINGWYAVADYNIGTEPGASDMTVVDVDNKHGHNGNASWHDLCETNGGQIKTLAVKSPNWGMHYYFTGTLPSSAGKLGDGLDIRSIGGYVLLPPSVVDGREYKIVANHPVAPLPAWIKAKLDKPKRDPAVAPEHVVVDPERIEEWVEALIELTIEHDGPAEVHHNLNDRTHKLACRLGDGPQYGYAVGEDTAVELILTHWSAEDRVDETVRSAYRSRENPLGCGQAGTASRNYDPIFGIRKFDVKDAIADLHRLEEWRQLKARVEAGEPLPATEAPQLDPGVDHGATSIRTAPGSEDQIALRFAKQEGDRLRYVDEWKTWMLFDGTVWRRAPSPAIWNLARPYVRQAALQMESTTQQRSMLARTKVAGVEALARGDLLRPGSAWDTDPWQLNTPGGTVDLRTGRMYPAMAAAFGTKLTAAAPGGDCPRWLQFLAEVTDGDRELQAYLQRLAGLTLIGKVIDHVLPFFYGTGNNGKGVYLETLGAILADYAQVAPMSLFTEKRNEQHPTGIARLQGARFVRAQETEQGRAWDETLIKTLTGGDRLTGRFMHGNFFEFDPQHTLIIAGNHKPLLRNVDEAIRRRIHMVPFTVTIPVEKRDERLREKLTVEGGGILRWAIEGCLDYQQAGLRPPAAVRDMTSEYLDGQDPLSEWLADCCIKGGDAFTAKPVLHASYVSHCRKAGTTAFIPEEFYAKLENHGFAAGKRVGVRGIRGITLKA